MNIKSNVWRNIFTFFKFDFEKAGDRLQQPLVTKQATVLSPTAASDKAGYRLSPAAVVTKQATVSSPADALTITPRSVRIVILIPFACILL